MKVASLYKIYFYALFFISTSAFGNKGASPAEDWIIQNIYGPSQVGIVQSIPIDIDQDGDMDVVSASIEDGQLRAYLNQGGSVFEEVIINKDVPGVFRFSAVDINADEQTDFLLTSIETNEVLVLISQNGQYIKSLVASAVLLPTDAQAGYFNQDQLLDVISISFEDNSVFLHLQQPDGSFLTSLISDQVIRPRKIELEDLDNDDDLDILVASSDDNSVRIFVNDGSSEFSEQLISDQLNGVRYVVACDVDQNNLIDFVVSAAEDDQLLLFNNQGDLMFNQVSMDDALFGANALHCQDIDGDQQNELVAISSANSEIYLYETTGAFAKTLIANNRDGYVEVNAADFDGDGAVEILTQSFFEHRNLLYLPHQNNQEVVVWEDFPDGAYYVTSADIDGDGDDDAVVTSLSDNRLFWLERIQQKFIFHGITNSIEAPQSVVAGDLDADGDLDLVTAGAFDDRFWIHYNDGSGNFSTAVLLDGPNNPARASIGDMNGDLIADIVVTSSLDNTLRLLIQNEGVFEQEIIDDDLTGAFDIELLDINQDGLLDVLATGLRDSNVNLYTQNQTGGFDLTVLFDSAMRSNTIQSIDFAGNELPDVSFESNDSLVNLINNDGVTFDLVDALVLVADLITYVFKGGDNANELRFVGSLDSGAIQIVDLVDSIQIEEWLLESQFSMRAVSKTSSKDFYFAASSVDNSVKLIFKDLIMKSSFD